MEKELKRQWRRFGLLEFEHSARNVFRSLIEQGGVRFESEDLQKRSQEEQRQFVENQTVPYFYNGIRQAREYFEHAYDSSVLIKPLLHYYGAMSLAKSLVLFAQPDFFLNKENLRHGLSLPTSRFDDSADTFERISVKVGTRGIFPAVHNMLYKVPIPIDFLLPLKDVITRLPDLESETTLLLKHRPVSLILGNVISVNRDKLPPTLRVECTITADHAAHVRGKFMDNWKEDWEVSDYGDRLNLKSKTEYAQVLSSEAQRLIRDYFDLKGDGTPFLAKPLLAGSEEVPMREVELLYMLIFAFGSLARYHPNIWADLNSGRQNLFAVMVNDAIELFEFKFLSLVVFQLDRFHVPIIGL